jgi:hypothetical protein
MKQENKLEAQCMMDNLLKYLSLSLKDVLEFYQNQQRIIKLTKMKIKMVKNKTDRILKRKLIWISSSHLIIIPVQLFWFMNFIIQLHA